MPRVRPRLAWFSPLPFSEEWAGDSAWFSEQILPLLRDRFDIELFHNSFDIWREYPTYHYLTAADRQRAQPYDAFVYQVEDSRRTDFARMHLGLIPGVVLFHSYLLSSDGPEPMLNSPWRDVVRHYQDGQVGWPDRMKTQPKDSKLALRESGLALVSIFSSERDIGEYRRLHQEQLLPERTEGAWYLPVPVPAFSRSLDDAVSGQKKKVLFCGPARIESRVHKLLEALSPVQEALELCWLVAEEDKERAQGLLDEFAIRSVQLHTGLNPQRYQEQLSRAWAAVHTRFSVFGHTSPYLELSLMAGVPVLVTDFGAAEHLPDSVVFKIPPGDQESLYMRAVLQRVCAGDVPLHMPRSREFALERFDRNAVASELSAILERSLPQMRTALERWQTLEHEARQSVALEAGALLRIDDMPFLDAEKNVVAARRELGWTW